MRKTNHVKPINTNIDESKQSVMTTTTQIDIVRRIEVTPIVNKS